MRFFDAHCDTVMRVFDANLDFLAGRGKAHVDLPRLLSAGNCVQLFAVFSAQSHYPGRDEHAYADQAIETIWGWSRASEGRMKMALTAADIRSACAGDGFYGLLGLEGADCLGTQADELDHFVAAGVRNVIVAWADNAFSGTVFGQGGPLTAEGARLIERCEASQVMVDVSHLSDPAFWQVHALTRRPFVASHSDCRAVSPSVRNLTDEMIRALADRGGVMGINLSPDFLDPTYLEQFSAIATPARAAIAAESDPDRQAGLKRETGERMARIPLPDLSIVARHVKHAIDVGGEDCIGLGGDLDGIDAMPAPMQGVESYPLIPELLRQAGLSEAQVEKVCWRNMARVYADVLPA